MSELFSHDDLGTLYYYCKHDPDHFRTERCNICEPVYVTKITGQITPTVTIERPREMAYVDIGDIRISILNLPHGLIIRSYGLDGDIENAKNYAAVLAEAILIAEEWG